ncbi:DoxX family protein [Archangium violaceum]|uniref:DoxX family protein n=1 Tax=Archangium violaceum TaxID=83451 RepID=UPI00193B55B8|nr:DoxX family protein [Archangium violaceum]QRK10284.1 DoxX family protein [Archangium violaceum]
MDALAPLGRLLFSAIFIFSGFNHFANGEAMMGYARSAGLPFPALAIYGSGVVLLVGGVCILLGVFARIAAVAIAVFLVAAALTMHRFWGLPPQEAAMQMTHFWKNISMAGGALLLVHFGPGPYSIRARSRVLLERQARRLPPALRPRPQS